MTNINDLSKKLSQITLSQKEAINNIIETLLVNQSNSAVKEI